MRSWIAAASLAVIAFGCTKEDPDTREWSNSVRSPNSFAPWAGSEAISLPAPRTAFADFVVNLGAEISVTGEGDTPSMGPPTPMPDSPCSKTDKALLVYFPMNAHKQPGYTAYVDAEGEVVCVEKRFSYPSLPPMWP